MPCKRTQRGFTLAELAITVLIIGLLMGGLLGPISRQVDQSRVNETQRQIENAREALLGYAVINKKLPCPDTTGDGVAETTCSGASLVGNLPWATLGLPESDAWGTRLRYAVSASFTSTITLTTTGALAVNQRSGTTKANTSLAGGTAPSAAAVILSFGKNSYGGTLADGTAAGTARPAVPATNVDETANAAAGAATFAIRTPVDASTPCSDTTGTTSLCEFDDLVVWLSPPIIISRMVAAGQLP